MQPCSSRLEKFHLHSEKNPYSKPTPCQTESCSFWYHSVWMGETKRFSHRGQRFAIALPNGASDPAVRRAKPGQWELLLPPAQSQPPRRCPNSPKASPELWWSKLWELEERRPQAANNTWNLPYCQLGRSDDFTNPPLLSLTAPSWWRFDPLNVFLQGCRCGCRLTFLSSYTENSLERQPPDRLNGSQVNLVFLQQHTL